MTLALEMLPLLMPALVVLRHLRSATWTPQALFASIFSSTNRAVLYCIAKLFDVAPLKRNATIVRCRLYARASTTNIHVIFILNLHPDNPIPVCTRSRSSSRVYRCIGRLSLCSTNLCGTSLCSNSSYREKAAFKTMSFSGSEFI